MANTNYMDLSNRLNKSETILNIGGDRKYRVNKSYKTFMEVQAMMEDQSQDMITKIFKAIEMVLGKKARGEVENMPVEDIETVFIGMLAAVQNEPFEVVEARFHGTEEGQGATK